MTLKCSHCDAYTEGLEDNLIFQGWRERRWVGTPTITWCPICYQKALELQAKIREAKQQEIDARIAANLAEAKTEESRDTWGT